MNEILKINQSDFLTSLKESTRPAHELLEKLPLSMAIVSPEVTEYQYFSYLSKMNEIVGVIETEIYPLVKAIIPDFDVRLKSHRLVMDLAYSKDADIIPTHPFVLDVEQITVPMALGIVYVLEGSSLGGRFILQNISAVLGYNAEHGASYFAGYGTKTGSYWKTFLHDLQQYEQLHNCGNEIVIGANLAFNSIHNYLKE